MADDNDGRLRPNGEDAERMMHEMLGALAAPKNLLGHAVTETKNSAVQVGAKIFALGTVVTLVLALLIGFVATIGGLLALDLYGII